ncbi:GerAB/ArcD/ProY family transporter [Ureibacillus aquaedulcis]|uniref:GerAB/ArcD/ProY family transporter n=1 Tax=Ureibacillus aquaedulcis TaxID=3058421 RepID=A0ABT8GW33_9BACL|nr:GerAB/ArcD/ProY family transporter [Ureibacillus sp. BA0131]MDN4495617.1 GerAB/ArcD/ProY family transporter [Ureibacillus sp. BA0131]
MNTKLQISPAQMFNAPLLFFFVTKVQIGVGVYGFQSLIYEEAKQDSWISIIISFLASHIIVFVMFKVLEMYDSNDIYGINIDLFGKLFGNFINFLLVIYSGVIFFTILNNFSEVMVTWVFPDINSSFIIITVLLLVIYTFTGGLRVIIGLCFIGFFLPQWMLGVLVYPLEFANANYLFPIFDNDLISLLKGAYAMSFTIVGFEALTTLYPYVKEKKKAQLYVHLGLLYTLVVYLFVMLVSLLFFSGEQLERVIWATLSLFSIVRLPFFERIEIFTVCFWIIVILPNLCIYAWSAYRGIGRIIKVNQKTFILFFTAIIFIGSFLIETQYQMNVINKISGHVSFYIVFVLPFFIYFIAFLKNKIFKRQVRKN